MTSIKSQPFPLRLPASLTHRDEIIRNDWDAFRSLDTLTDHWSRPAWQEGAQAYYWLLALGDQSSLRAAAARCQAHLAALAHLDLVPLSLLHLTMHRVGAVDQVSNAQLALIASAADERLTGFGPLRLQVGPLAGSTGAVRFTVTPWDKLMRLKELLAESSQPAHSAPSPNGLRPHVSIAYNNKTRPATRVVERVGSIRQSELAEVTVDHAALVLLRRDGRAYHWTAIHRTPLRVAA